MSDFKAIVSFLPCQYGDGYSWGGGTVLTIGERSFYIGTNRDGADEAFAREIARRWNDCSRQQEALVKCQKTIQFAEKGVAVLTDTLRHLSLTEGHDVALTLQERLREALAAIDAVLQEEKTLA